MRDYGNCRDRAEHRARISTEILHGKIVDFWGYGLTSVSSDRDGEKLAESTPGLAGLLPGMTLLWNFDQALRIVESDSVCQRKPATAGHDQNTANDTELDE